MFLCSEDEFVLSLDPSLGDFLWQDGSISSTYVINEGGTYTLIISNICGSESDEIIFSDLDVPEVQIGVDEATICNGDIFEIEIDETLGDILWQDGSSEPNLSLIHISEPTRPY